MWYVIQTSTGREEKIKQECEQRISKDVLSHCVLPLYEEKIKYKGQWHIFEISCSILAKKIV